MPGCFSQQTFTTASIHSIDVVYCYIWLDVWDPTGRDKVFCLFGKLTEPIEVR